ncbi:hypothetical protein E1B28_003595 [Marasmius oreades]|uniref:Uncharacterized protein n=1 Tax=Marasmius oreades TaxID=181124 RepID=A0A9P7RMV0_9AGAR|nr:uncharacterized protein E1B28_003595 [Marasmius oreades]KAG7086078.1 hypothetical protein E1B28_003595 [Marasmius oreades]
MANTKKTKKDKAKGGQHAGLMMVKNKVMAAAVQAPTKLNLKHALPPLPLPLSKKAKHTPKKPALRSTWIEDATLPTFNDNDEADSFESPPGTVHQRSPSIVSCTSSFLSGYHSRPPTSESGVSTRVPSETGDITEEAGVINEGGVLSDKDSGLMEYSRLNDLPTIQESNSTLKSKVKSMAKINIMVTGPNLPVHRTRVTSGFETKFGVKHNKITVKHLDNKLQELFAKIYTPYIRHCVGIGLTRPWDNLSEADLITTWNSFLLKAGNPELTEFQREVVLKLTNDRLGEWRNSFTTAAITTLDTILSAVPTNWEPELSDTERRSAYAQWLGEGEDHERNFYYREISLDEQDEDQLLKKGIFQSQLMSVTLATHLTAISSLQDTPYIDSKLPPKGALVLCVQACKRALAMFDTGVKVVPTGIAGHFSRANWMDQDQYVDGGQVIKDQSHTSLLQSIVGDITMNQWKAILKAGSAVMKQKPTAGKAESTNQLVKSPPRKKVVDHNTYSDDSE